MTALDKKPCEYSYIDNNGDHHRCGREAIGKSSYCVFHDPNTTKGGRYYEALTALFDRPGREHIDCRGFRFHEFFLTSKEIPNDIDFRDAVFLGDLGFNGCNFHGKVTWLGAEFMKRASFQGATFHRPVSFMGCRFHDKAIFVGTKFLGKAIFHGNKFLGLATFQDSLFEESAVFQGDTFQRDADFHGATFSQLADFSKTIFRRKANFKSAKFSGEVQFSEVNAQVIKDLRGSSICFDGATLESCNFWGLKTVESYSFRDAFLIACNFSGISFVNCDFTGAVIKSPHVLGWEVDEQTLTKTRYIYTDYAVLGEADTRNPLELRIARVEDSRVPRSGEFGDDSNSDFRFADFVREQIRWEFLVRFPIEIQTGLINYLNFFRDYCRVTNDLDIEVATENARGHAKVVLLLDDEADKDALQEVLRRYIGHIIKPFDRYEVVFKRDGLSTKEDKELLLINLQNEIATNQARFAYALNDLQARQQTVEGLAQFLLLTDDREKDRLHDHLSKALDALGSAGKVTQHVTVAPVISSTATISVSGNIDDELRKLITILRLGAQDAAHAEVLEGLASEAEELRRTSGVGDSGAPVGKIRDLLRKIGSVAVKTGDYAISNAGDLLAIIDRILPLMK